MDRLPTFSHLARSFGHCSSGVAVNFAEHADVVVDVAVAVGAPKFQLDWPTGNLHPLSFWCRSDRWRCAWSRWAGGAAQCSAVQCSERESARLTGNLRRPHCSQRSGPTPSSKRSSLSLAPTDATGRPHPHPHPRACVSPIAGSWIVDLATILRSETTRTFPTTTTSRSRFCR